MLIYIWWALVFLVGLVVGSALNVLIFRLAIGRSALWPSSHCFSCFNAIKWYDNLPIFGYLILGGRCRKCHNPYSARYLITELLIGILFAMVFFLEMLAGVHALPGFASMEELIWIGGIPLEGWLLVLFHLIWLSFAWIAFGCARITQRIPVSVGMTALGLAFVLSLIYPWPWPTTPIDRQFWMRDAMNSPLYGVQIWPIWYPTPASLPPDSELLGLMTCLAGAGLAWLPLRLMRRPAGEIAYAMSVGGLFGWQVMLIILLLSLALWSRIRPFGATIPLATLIALLTWQWIGPLFYRCLM